MNSKVDVHQVFADYFKEPIIKALAYQCSEKLSEGHICIDFQEFQTSLEQPISKAELLQHRWITEDPSETEVFIFHKDKIYFHRYFIYETKIIESLKALVQNEDVQSHRELLLKDKDFIQQLFPNNEKDVDWQMVACLMAYTQHFSMITGGPGTGKTTTIAKLLSMVFKTRPNTRVSLVAPTGKAAARMKESLNLAQSNLNSIDESIKQKFDQIHSSTIHRLLGYKKHTHYFKHNKEHPVPYDIVIVDESSMMGMSLMSKLIEAISPKSQLILLGDKNQLASVEAGSVFGDICQSQMRQMNTFSDDSIQFLKNFVVTEKIVTNNNQTWLNNHIIELQKSYRFDASKGIGKLSHAILNHQFKANADAWFMVQDDQVKFHTQFEDQAFKAFYAHYENYLKCDHPKAALKAFNQVRILTPTHLGHYSVDYFNREVEQYLIKKDLIQKHNHFYHNQPIMITQNDYQLQLFNGDVGLIREDEHGQLWAYFESEDGTLKSINTNFIHNFDTVYAMTIHKSQGSEFEKVALVVPPNKDLGILSKELLYTGLTRAKEQLHIFSAKAIFNSACEKPVARASGIAERMVQAEATA